MRSNLRVSGRHSALAALLATLLLSGAARAQGLMLQGVGPVNRSMAGVATALPLDAGGAIYRNPATMSALKQSEVTFGAELLLQTETLSSTFPIGPVSGVTEGEPGAMVLPTVAMVHHDRCSGVTYGLGMYGVAGFKANYPSSLTNPVAAPQPNGLGRIYADLQVFDVAPAVSFDLTPRLSFGISPFLSVGQLNATPLFLASPDDANTDTAFTYPNGVGNRYHYGAGVQVGLFYQAANCWNVGASVKSPTWFEDFRFDTTDEVGAPRFEELNFDLPMIVSLGLSYTGYERLQWGIDFRYFDYANTPGFDSAGYDITGAATGLGWKNVFSVSTAAQYALHERLRLRLGYTFQTSPIDSDTAFYNVASPLVLGHIVSIGGSLDLSRSVAFNIAYLHAFEASVTGPWVLPGVGAVPGSSVTSDVSADALGMGMTVAY